jgi:K+-sensing histidine kinase KdpD
MNGEVISGSEYYAIKKDGNKIPLLLYSAPVIRDGKPVGMRVFAGDISDRKRMENALLEMNRKLNLLNSITRHDVRNQLSALYGYMSLVNESVKDPQAQTYMDSLKKAAETVQQLIDFTKDYQEIGVKAPLWQNVRHVIINANGNHLSSQYNILIDIHDVEIYADILLERVFFNLVDNVNRYAGKISELRMTGREVPGGYLITCEDDGTGIPLNKKEAIFKRQYFKHTGFGLFLSREILAITGITIRETGEPGKGARFEIFVPNGSYRFTKTDDEPESRT